MQPTQPYTPPYYNAWLPSSPQAGEPIDQLNGVIVYYNGSVVHVDGLHFTADGYYLGYRYQCVELVKRYYWQRYKHRFPDSYGHASSYFKSQLADGDINEQRGLMQCKNPSQLAPHVEDIIIFGPSKYNQWGHVALISKVANDSIEIIQQNPGAFAANRESLPFYYHNGFYFIQHQHVVGRLRYIGEEPPIQCPITLKQQLSGAYIIQRNRLRWWPEKL